MKTNLADKKLEIFINEAKIQDLKAATGSQKTEKIELEPKLIYSQDQKSDWQTKEADHVDKINKISKEKSDLTISLKNSERLLQKVTNERDLLKSSLGTELKPAQDQLIDIMKERDLLSSFLKFTADSTISFSKLLSQISIGIMRNFLLKLANLDDITSHLSTTRDYPKSLELPETLSEDLKTLITGKLYEAMDVKSSVDSG